MKKDLLDYYLKGLERLMSQENITKEMAFNLLNIDNKEELEKILSMEDGEFLKTLS